MTANRIIVKRGADITGLKFWNMTVLSFSHRKGRGNFWACKCLCGNIKLIERGNILGNLTKSCGCTRYKGKNCFQPVHGLSKHPIFTTWLNMKSRCENPSSKAFKNYGGRGIAICEEWQSAEVFYEWAIKNGWSKDLQLDRQENDKGYYPDNCRFVSREINMSNRRNTHRFNYNGQLLTHKDLAKISDCIPVINIASRLKNGWSIEDAISMPVFKTIKK